MVIKNISKLSKLGIFKNFTNTKLQDFGKYNLVYGWNGSGKTTLSDLFRCLELGFPPEKFPEAEFIINLEDGSKITKANIGVLNLNLHTFNQDFIDENISWNDLVKSILIVDKEKIADFSKYEDLKREQQADEDSFSRESQELVKLQDSISKFATDSARHMKTSLQAIDTNDKYYLNYDKRKFETFVESSLELTKLDSSILDEKKLLELTVSAKPNQKSKVTFAKLEIKKEVFVKAKSRLESLLKESVLNKTIQRLLDNSEIKNWVETGLEIHRQHELDQCEFCGNKLTNERIQELEAHFNNDYKVFQERLSNAKNWLLEQQVQVTSLPAKGDFYDEFQNEYEVAIRELENKVVNLNKEIEDWCEILNQKISNPLEVSLTVNFINENSIIAFNDAMIATDKIVRKHNYKYDNFQQETEKAKKQLELHYAATEIKSFQYHEKQKLLGDKLSGKGNLERIIENRKKELEALENSLKNEGLGADKFNESLHKFLGRRDLKLKFNTVKKGYEILRNETEPVNGQLSEGEKTAIGFVYFITKLHESNNKIEDSIIVVDDPVSSFDSNHLFHAYSFLRSNCELAKQIFVLTHNFTYFKLVRDWFDGVNKSRRRKDKEPNAYFFTIESTIDLPRESTINNADTNLVNYNSEYHYIFSRLYRYISKAVLSPDDAFLTANLSRKLLEAFFSFKYPKYRTDFSQLMSQGLRDCKVTNETTKEKIYRFINKYSHSLVIEINEDSSDNLLGESQNVIKDIFVWISEVDETHYKEMLESMQ